jgi:branched-chain amino acid transport system substrate-binding protein
MLGGLLGACGGSGDSKNTLKIGFVSPRTAPAATFGEVDPYVLGLATDAVWPVS